MQMPTHTTPVISDWLDYNGHMNVAYYTLAFDLAGEAFVHSVGLGEDHTQATGNSWMVLEAHITYQQEAILHDELEITSQLLGLEEKRFQLFQLMRRKNDGALLASNDQLVLHVNLRRRRTQPFAPNVWTNLQALYAEHIKLERPPEAGRRVDMTLGPPRRRRQPTSD